MEELGERIRLLRAKLKLPRAEFALLIGISSAALFNYESGDRAPSADILLRICEETLANPQWLLMGRGPIYETELREACVKAASEIVDKVLNRAELELELDDHVSLLQDAIESIDNNITAFSPNKENATWSMGYKQYSKAIEREAKLSESTKHIEEKTRKSVVQKAQGNNIIQAGGDVKSVNINSINKKIDVSVQPPKGTIGANAFLVERIKGLFNELGLRREERFGKTAYPVMYNEFKKAFSIPRNQKYTTYLLWPESRAKEIIDYLEEKLSNTIKGRIQKSAKTKGQARPHLLGETSRLHKMLGWSEQEYRAHLHYLFGVTSRSELDQAQLANYVAYLKEQVDGRD